jgi:hypothetical protein
VARRPVAPPPGAARFRGPHGEEAEPPTPVQAGKGGRAKGRAMGRDGAASHRGMSRRAGGGGGTGEEAEEKDGGGEAEER